MAEDAKEPSIADLTAPIKLSIPGIGTILAHELYFKSEVDSLYADMQSRIQKTREAYENARARSSVLERENKRLVEEARQLRDMSNELRDEMEGLRSTLAGLYRIMGDAGNLYSKLWTTRLIYATANSTVAAWTVYRRNHPNTAIPGYNEWKARWDRVIKKCRKRLFM